MPRYGVFAVPCLSCKSHGSRRRDPWHRSLHLWWKRTIKNTADARACASAVAFGKKGTCHPRRRQVPMDRSASVTPKHAPSHAASMIRPTHRLSASLLQPLELQFPHLETHRSDPGNRMQTRTARLKIYLVVLMPLSSWKKACRDMANAQRQLDHHLLPAIQGGSNTLLRFFCPLRTGCLSLRRRIPIFTRQTPKKPKPTQYCPRGPRWGYGMGLCGSRRRLTPRRCRAVAPTR